MSKKIGTLIKTIKTTRKINDNLSYDDLLLFYRDENGEKKVIFYDRPLVDFYVLKDKSAPEATTPPLYIELDKVDHFSTFSDNLYRSVAEKTGAMAYYDRIRLNNGPNSYNMNNLFKSPLLYGADVDLEDQYIAKFYREFDPDPNYTLHKCYYDIETDIYHFTGFPDPKDALTPVCLITLIDEKAMKAYTFILRNAKNALLTDFEKDTESFKTYMKEKTSETDNLNMDFELLYYDDEVDLIIDFFKKVHEIDPDYCAAWNASFDFQTLMNRLERLLKEKSKKDKNINPYYDTREYMCDSKYLDHVNERGANIHVTPKAYYSKGRERQGIRTDTFVVVDGINWIDQMLTYESIHISGGKLDSYKLDYVANVELGKEKLPYGPGETIRNLLYKNTKRFVEYNIRDVLLLLLIEEKTLDINTLQKLADITVTRREKAFKKSIAITNYVAKYALEQNLVMSTNKNTDYGDSAESAFYESQFTNTKDVIETDEGYLKLINTKDKFGAFVSDPNNNDNVGMEVFKAKMSKYLWELVCDFDFSSLYPSLIRTFNLDSRNIVGKFYCIDNKIKQNLKENYDFYDSFLLPKKNKRDDEEPSDDEEDEDEDVMDAIKTSGEETDDLGMQLADAIISQDWNMIGKIYFELPSSEDIIKDLKNKRRV